MNKGTVYGCTFAPCSYRWAPTTMVPSWMPEKCPCCAIGKWVPNPPKVPPKEDRKNKTK